MASKMGILISIVSFSLLFVSKSDGFCGDDRLLYGNLARSSMRASEFLRKKLMNENVFKDDGIQGHHLGVTLHSLRLAGYTVDRLSELTVGKQKLESIIDQLNPSEINTGQAAYYLYGALAICQDPQRYAKLVDKLEKGIPTYPNVGYFNHPFQYGLAVLAICMSGNGQSSYPDYAIKLKQLINESGSLHHVGDTLGLLTMALACIYPHNKLKNDQSVKQTLISSAKSFIRSQRPDGGFGNSITTAIAIQTLLSIKQTGINADVQKWDCKKTMNFLLSRQSADGSFVTYLMSVTQVLPALVGAIPGDIPNKLKCPPKPTTKPIVMINVCIRIEFNTTTPNGTLPQSPKPYYGSFQKDTTVYTMIMTAHNSKQYSFGGKFGPYGFSVRSINGVARDPANKKYWMIYVGPFPGSPGIVKSAGTGVTRLRLKDKTCVIFKYLKLNFR